jgi:hypothetical protein
VRVFDAGTDYALDVIGFATGFDAMTGAMKEVDIHTDAGKQRGRDHHKSRQSLLPEGAAGWHAKFEY